MKRLVAFFLMLGLIASAPLAVSAQEKQEKQDETKQEKQEPKTAPTDESKKTETMKTTSKSTSKPAAKAGDQGPVEYAQTLIPIINLVLLAVVFVLILNVRGTVAQLEEKMKGGGA